MQNIIPEINTAAFGMLDAITTRLTASTALKPQPIANGVVNGFGVKLNGKRQHALAVKAVIHGTGMHRVVHDGSRDENKLNPRSSLRNVKTAG